MLLATRSAGKLRELGPLLAEAGLEARTLDQARLSEWAEEAMVEAFETFEENALAKARYFHRRGGLPAVADDSGLCVDALGGQPGVHSRRWCGRTDLTGPSLDDANNAKLLAALTSEGDRRAHFVCVAAYVDAAHEVVGRGEVHGTITHVPRGDHGFGYDPLFECDELALTFGEASLAAKQRVSHRARAFRSLARQLAHHG